VPKTVPFGCGPFHRERTRSIDLLMSTGSGANVATDPAGKQALVAGAFDSRVVLAPRDELEIGPFPGWAKVPEWQS
jgi:hypothetical protein